VKAACALLLLSSGPSSLRGIYTMRLVVLARHLKISQRISSENNLKFKMEMASRIPFRMANAKIAWDKFDDADNGKILTPEQIRIGPEKSELLIGTPGLYIWCLAHLIPKQNSAGCTRRVLSERA
jgi:hypothetical protein